MEKLKNITQFKWSEKNHVWNLGKKCVHYVLKQIALRKKKKNNPKYLSFKLPTHSPNKLRKTYHRNSKSLLCFFFISLQIIFVTKTLKPLLPPLYTYIQNMFATNLTTYIYYKYRRNFFLFYISLGQRPQPRIVWWVHQKSKFQP